MLEVAPSNFFFNSLNSSGICARAFETSMSFETTLSCSNYFSANALICLSTEDFNLPHSSSSKDILAFA
jgi:hypothetical protein